ncbi:PhoU family transcriptional regulator [Halorhodospira abdelmalekii]|uniref:phosphate signaling complex PhoU family protein n=1 Tax=Halorhodospira abdelmalekii TaxID=421629 RepID=UPI001905E804|nr:PhoU domain-containing protein [Halorhodospira abdelmalekii]MBK1736079.1 PhoU family transcriptional regulator [Halorhodospira abdelmalekii]
MLQKILGVFTKESAVDRAFAELNEMLAEGAWMFERANEVLHNRLTAEEVASALYERDRKINELERSIRRKVLRHLTVNPGYDVPVCLALMTVARDAERIGDYCKNVYEIGCHYTEGFHVPKYHDPLEQISAETLTLFNLVGEACRDSSREQQAREVKQTARDIQDRCEAIIAQLFEDESRIEFHEAVAYSLLARHYKRVAAHLANIASAVLGELAELDFKSE